MRSTPHAEDPPRSAAGPNPPTAVPPTAGGENEGDYPTEEAIACTRPNAVPCYGPPPKAHTGDADLGGRC